MAREDNLPAVIAPPAIVRNLFERSNPSAGGAGLSVPAMTFTNCYSFGRSLKPGDLLTVE
jgi:hypothetical protein